MWKGVASVSANGEDLEVRLLKQAEKAIRHLLEQKGERRDLSMSEMEDLVGELEIDLRQALMQELVDEAQARDGGLCVECGGKLRYKGKKAKRVVTLRGEVEIERDYYRCETCQRGYFPPG
jgi:uncharacterized protein with PIN domain